jgi:hypothetical protein
MLGQALLTASSLLHEFYVAAGHLAAINDGSGARLHAVTTSTEQSHVESSRYKVLELDADVMALRHLTMNALSGQLRAARGAHHRLRRRAVSSHRARGHAAVPFD